VNYVKCSTKHNYKRICTCRPIRTAD